MQSEQADEQLMTAVANGDTRAFRHLAERWMPRSYSIARRVLNSPQDAEEAVQDAFTRLWTYAPTFQSERAAFSTWFYRIIVNACLDRRRKLKPAEVDIDLLAEVLPDDSPNPENVAIKRAEAAYLRRAVQALPPRQQMAVTLTYFEELTNLEAAAAMQMHVKALEGLLVRARRSLRDSLSINYKGGVKP